MVINSLPPLLGVKTHSAGKKEMNSEVFGGVLVHWSAYYQSLVKTLTGPLTTQVYLVNSVLGATGMVYCLEKSVQFLN